MMDKGYRIIHFGGDESSVNPDDVVMKADLFDSSTGYIKAKYIDGQPSDEYVKKSKTKGLLKNDGTVDTSAYYVKPQNGIPEDDLSDEIKDAIENAKNAYRKPQNGIPFSDFDSSVKLSLLNADSALQPIDVSDVATSGNYNDLKNIPENVSEFINDAGYLTEHQDISGKADKATTYTKTEVDERLLLKADSSAVNDIADNVSKILSANYSTQYFTTVSLEEGTVSFIIGSGINKDLLYSVSYSTDDGSTWNTIYNEDGKESDITIDVSTGIGDRVLWKGTAIALSDGDENISSFVSDIKIDVCGNIMSLLYGDDFIGKTRLHEIGNTFYELFEDDINGGADIVHSHNLVFPATELADDCYNSMFSGCKSLITTPELPAKELSPNCYSSMFRGCTSLKQAPELPAKELSPNCYSSMFSGCTSLKQAPELPANVLGPGCYSYMFRGCTSLIEAPELPAKELASDCYSYMFRYCISLAEAPDLNASVLVGDCYSNMFYECSSINYIKCLAETSESSSCTDWVYNVNPTGVFVKSDSADFWDYGSSGIPIGWAFYDNTEYEYCKRYELNGKQDSIDDLDSIRSGAAAGLIAYQKPSTGIPKTDLDSSVQVSLSKADTALQSFTETDPTVPGWAKAESKPTYTASEVGAVPTTRKVNGKSLSVDITLSASDVSALPSSTVIPDELSDLSDDSTHRLVTDAEKTTWSGAAEDVNDNTINGSSLTNSTSYWFGTSSTDASTVQKEVSIPSIKVLNVGQIIVIKPSVTSNTINSTLKLNSFDAYPMLYNNEEITTSAASMVWSASYPSIWLFDGEHWVFLAHGVDINTTYSDMSVSEGIAGTATNARTVRADYLKKIIEANAPKADWDENDSTDPAYIKNKPTIPSKTSDLTNDSGFITEEDIPEVPAASTTTPKMDGVAEVGTEKAFARGDHRHPTDTSRQAVITSSSKLSADLIEDGSTNKTVTAIEKSVWDSKGTYSKPNGGIPKTDLNSLVQESLSKADTALQNFTEADPIFKASAAYSIESSDISNWNAKQDLLVSGTSIKTINNQSILGSGDVSIGTLSTVVKINNNSITSNNEANIVTKGQYDSSTNKIATINDLPTVPKNISEFTNDAGYLVEQDIYDDLAAVAVSGNYADLKNTPDIPDISNCIKKSATAGLVKNNGTIDTNTYLTQHQDISGKYDKTGGTITGDVKVEGTFTVDIDDEDYDAGITASGELNDNLGTILTLQGYAGDTPYKALVRNIATPNSNYDAANKKYVDDNVVVPTYHLVELNADWSVKTIASTLIYSSVASNLTNPKEADYLDIIKETSTGSNIFIRFHVPCVGIDEVNQGNIIFNTNMFVYNNMLNLTLRLDNQSNLTTVAVIQTPESAVNKVNSVINYSTSTLNYPSTKAVYDEYQRKPVTVWQWQSGDPLIKALNVNIARSLNWQITDLDLTQYKRLKFYITGGVSSNNISPHVVIEMSIADGAATTDTYNHYTASGVYQYLNNDNRLYTVIVCVNSNKNSVCFLRQTSLYGTAGTSAVDDSRHLYKIEGYFD